MAERNKPNGQHPDDYHIRSLQALDKALKLYGESRNSTVEELGHQMLRRALFAERVEKGQLSFEETLLAGAAFSATLGVSPKHFLDDDGFVRFLKDSAVDAAQRDGIRVQNAAILQPQLPGMDDPSVVNVQAEVVNAVAKAQSHPNSNQRALNLPQNRGLENRMAGLGYLTDGAPTKFTAVKPVSTPRTEPQPAITPESKQIARRKLLTWLGYGGVAAVSGGGFIAWMKHLADEYERQNPYEQRNKLTTEFTPSSLYSRVRFRYPHDGSNFVNKYGNRAVVIHTPSNTTYLQVALPWDNSELPNVKKAIITGVFLETFTDSTGKLVPKISYHAASTGPKKEYVPVGHITASEGSHARDHSDIVEMYLENNDTTLSLSLVAKEVPKRNSNDKEQIITVTTLEKAPKSQ